MQPESEQYPTLMAQHAFVVQLRADTRIETGQMRGRVEHVVSRQAVTFESLETLLAFMARVLQEVRMTSPRTNSGRP